MHDEQKQQKLEQQFWDALGSDMTVMLGIVGGEESHMRPMTAQLLDDHSNGAIWFFTSNETELARELSGGGRSALLTFASKGHDLFATVHGALRIDNDRAVIDKLWSPFVAAWFEHGKDDPKLTLLRMDAREAEIWSDASSLLAGLKMLIGMDPKEEYRDKVAKVSLG